MNTFSPDSHHIKMMEKAKLLMPFTEETDLDELRLKMVDKLKELLGMDTFTKVDANLRIEYEKSHDDFDEIRFVFTTEDDTDVPCHLLTPKDIENPPLMICLQGHSPGMHISLAAPKTKSDEESIKSGDRDFGIQSVRKGFAALVMEQRCFGERKTEMDVSRGCHHASMVALLLGRTMVAERVWDVSRAIDVIEDNFPNIDASKIGIMGNSGGGTITYFASCIEKRITVSMPSCYVCTFKACIGSIEHCQCNYVPGILKYFDMGDMAVMIAPRPLIVVAGKDDPIFPIEGVKETFEIIKRVYTAAGVPDKCALIIGNGGHRFYADDAWPVYDELSGW